ncbi:unnamed protein product [Cuscuta epithymum]|uniref:Late embryogenesis abundant protein LEA-2 subgroup domain-containing protein n=1 Tax=Cuscuta epithymum TaxID=186058 RepID=A0AAV0F004_9ASTE|nr:unnamed protein product [Cuscuta epithymum]CAH9128790.1 unnamed protein product [Cuscuta epithymum]
MSQITIQSPKHCSKRELSIHKCKFNRRLFSTLLTFLISILSLIVLVWITLHPSKPEFSLTAVNIDQLNLTTSRLLYSSIQLTLLSRNPNKKIGIYYDEMHLFASYKGQQITVYSYVPPFYQGHEDTNLVSAALTGSGLPVAPSFSYEVEKDQSIGRLGLNVKAGGRLRWKVGTWVSGKYRFNVNCAAMMMPLGASMGSSSTRLGQGTQCSTTL